MGKRSKQKGTAYQVEIAKKLSAWYGAAFRSTPASGALRWKGHVWTFGDLLPPEDFPFSIECKHHHEVSLDEILARKKSPPGTGVLASWWYEQAVPDADRATNALGRKILPLLIWKEDYGRSRLCVANDLYAKISSIYRKPLVCFWVYVPEKDPFVVCDLDNFCQKVPPTALLHAHGQ